MRNPGYACGHGSSARRYALFERDHKPFAAQPFAAQPFAEQCDGLGNSWQLWMTVGVDRITCNPTVLNGQPTIRGMGTSVRRGIEALALYPNWDDLRREYPELEPEDIRQALYFAAQNLDDSVLPLEAV